jgi:hypothetical protein
MSNGVFFAGSITFLMRIRQGLGNIVQKNSISWALGSGFWLLGEEKCSGKETE